jgi:hypothetical protein
MSIALLDTPFQITRQLAMHFADACMNLNHADEPWGRDTLRTLGDRTRECAPELVEHVRQQLATGASCIALRTSGAPLPSSLNTADGPARMLGASTLLGLNMAVGFHPFGFRQERAGALIHDVLPEPGAEAKVSSSGRVRFDLHADCAYLDRALRPEVLALICLHDETCTETEIATLADVLEELSEDIVHQLALPNYVHRAPDSFSGKPRERLSSIIDRVDGHWEIKVATHSCEPRTAGARHALGALIESARKHRQVCRWAPGQILMLKNRECLHGRRAIRPGARHLLRCYGSTTQAPGAIVDLEAMTSSRQDRSLA